jgi:PadR family transcriptional regulator, regulatory protein AphA
MALEHAILGFLSGGPITGYDLKTRCFDEAAGHLWTADQAQVYRTLERLEDRGLARSKLVPQRGKPDRRLYTISAPGRAALAEWLRRPDEIAPSRDPFLLHLFFSGALPDDALLELLAHAREGHQLRLEHLRSDVTRDVDEWAASTGRVRDGEVRRLALGASLAVTRATIDWLDDCIDRVRRGLPPAQDGGA